MPSKESLNLMIGKSLTDLRDVRLPGLNKPFEQLTISELVQLRPGSEVSDTYEVNAVTDNISATTSAALEALGRVHKEKAMTQVVNQARLDQLRTALQPSLGNAAMGRVGGLSADQPGPADVSLGDPASDEFKAGGTDPFKAARSGSRGLIRYTTSKCCSVASTPRQPDQEIAYVANWYDIHWPPAYALPGTGRASPLLQPDNSLPAALQPLSGGDGAR